MGTAMNAVPMLGGLHLRYAEISFIKIKNSL